MSGIAPAQSQDAPTIKMLVESAYRGDSARMGWTHEADLLTDERIPLAEIERQLADPAVTILTARRDGAIVGCVATTRKDAGLAYLGMLSVSPAMQSAGVGDGLRRAAEGAAREAGAERMEIQVIDSRKSLIGWYERCGYRRTGEARPYPTPQDPPVRFAVLEKAL